MLLAEVFKEGWEWRVEISYLDLAVVKMKVYSCPNMTGIEKYEGIVERGSLGIESSQNILGEIISGW